MRGLGETFFNGAVIAKYLPALLGGFRVTLALAAAVVTLGLLLGLALAIARAFRIRTLNWLIVAFVDVFRTLPQLVVMIFLYFGLPYAGLTISAFLVAVLGLGLVLAAFAEEAFWAAITSIPRGQWEAARSTGLSFAQALASVVMPQAIRLAPRGGWRALPGHLRSVRGVQPLAGAALRLDHLSSRACRTSLPTSPTSSRWPASTPSSCRASRSPSS